MKCLCGTDCLSGEAAGFGYEFESEGDDVGVGKQGGGIEAAVSEGGVLQRSDAVKKARACVSVSATY